MPARYDYGGGTYPKPDIDKDGNGWAMCPYCWGEVEKQNKPVEEHICPGFVSDCPVPAANIEVEVQDWEGICPRCKRDVTFD